MLFTIFLAPAFLILFLLNPIKNTRKSFVKLKINKIIYNVEIANTPFKRSLGLMYRSGKLNNIMLFPYKRPCRPTFYNKNVNFPVRICFLDSKFRVISTFMMPSNSYKLFRPYKKISNVLEIGLVDTKPYDYRRLIEVSVV